MKYNNIYPKEENFMKKIVGLIVLLSLMVTLCASKTEKKHIDDQSVLAQATGIEQSTLPETVKETKAQKVEAVKETEPQKVETEENKTQPVQKPKGDKKEPCNLTLQNAFSEYEVIVTLTKQETAKNKTYTEKDFSDYGVFYVSENNEYYSDSNVAEAYPEYQGRTTLFLYLDKPSKENVLKTVKELENDERVFAACPNPISNSRRITLLFTNDYNEVLMNLASDYEKAKKNGSSDERHNAYHDFMEKLEAKIIQDFCYNESCGFNIYEHENVKIKPEIKVRIYIDNMYDAMKIFLKNPKIKKVVPYYNAKDLDGKVSITFKDPEYSQSNPYTNDTFKKYTDMKITSLWQKNKDDEKETDRVAVELTFEKPTYQGIADMISNLQKDSKVKNVYVGKRPVVSDDQCKFLF